MVEGRELNDEEFKQRISEESKKLNKITSNLKFRYKKNFSFFYDNMIIEKFRKDYPDKVKEYRIKAIKKEPWLKYQQQNLKQRVDRMIFPSVLEKREGVSRKGIGAHLVHLSYSENHERRTGDYGDNSGSNSDINYGKHYTLSDISASHPLQMIVEKENSDGELVKTLINCDPSLIDNPHYEDCLDRLKRPSGKIKSQNIGLKIEKLHKEGKSLEDIFEIFKRNDIPQSEIKKFIQILNDYEIICMSFGLRGYKPMIQEEIATVFKITQPAAFKRINKIKIKLSIIYKELEEEVMKEEMRIMPHEDIDLYSGEDENE